jgi:hypothetical protein
MNSRLLITSPTRKTLANNASRLEEKRYLIRHRMSPVGQNAKCSERAEDFRFAQTRTLLNAVGVSQRYHKRLSLNDCCWRKPFTERRPRGGPGDALSDQLPQI